MRTEAEEPINVARYAAGRDLAIAMLREAQDVTLIHRAAIVASERDEPTSPQRRWALTFLLELQRDPGLLDGFSAVVSDFLAAGSGGTPDHYARVTAAMLTQLPDAST